MEYFFINSNKIVTLCITHFPQLNLSYGKVAMDFCFYQQKPMDNSVYQDCLLKVNTYVNECNKCYPTKII